MNTPKRHLLYEKLSKMIPILDQLKAFNPPQSLSFPRIIVTGAQSAGKTSVLDSLIGFDFLPKGEGVVTRRPIEIQLIHVPQEDDEKPYIVFDDRKEKKLFDFELVRETIESMWRELRNRIADDPIKLSLYSSSCPDLTIIDTPGIWYNYYPPGNIPPDEDISKKIIKTYCNDENTLILCILPANSDLEASIPLRLAKEADPHGSRTIGVLTKVDIMDRGTNARRMVMGEDIPMRLGYIGLKCRSRMQRETQTIEQGLVEEKAFFRRHPVYCSMPTRYFGSESLAKKISNVFLTHIIQNMKSTIRDCQDKLKDLDLQYSLLDDRLCLLITKFIESLKQSLHEQDVVGTKLASHLENSGAITVRSLFSELYKTYRAAEYRSSTECSDRDIEKIMVVFDRDDSPVSSPVYDVFLFLLPPWLEKLREPALILTDSISNFLEGETINMIEKTFSGLPQIANFIKEISIKHLKVHYDKTRKIVEQLVDSEQNYLFMPDNGTLPRRFIPCPIMGNNGLRYDPTTRTMREKLDAYFSVCCRNLGDSVPKIIGTFLVTKYQDELQSVLFSEVKGDLVSESHNKSEVVLEKRELIIQNKIQLEKLISAIEKSASLLEELCDPKDRASHKQDSKESLIQLVESVIQKLDNDIE